MADTEKHMPITAALYGRQTKRPRRPQRQASTRRTFRVSDQLSPETRQQLAALQGRLEKQAANRKRRRRKAVAA